MNDESNALPDRLCTSAHHISMAPHRLTGIADLMCKAAEKIESLTREKADLAQYKLDADHLIKELGEAQTALRQIRDTMRAELDAANGLVEIARNAMCNCETCWHKWVVAVDENRGGSDADLATPKKPSTEWTDDLVARFLSWPLPASVCSDTCVTTHDYPHLRTGTNLLTHAEAKAMLDYVLADISIERDDDDTLREMMADILRRTAFVLKGEPGPLQGHGWQDLPEVAAALLAAPPAAQPDSAQCKGCEGRGVIGGWDGCGGYESVECHFCKGTGRSHPPQPVTPVEAKSCQE